MTGGSLRTHRRLRPAGVLLLALALSACYNVRRSSPRLPPIQLRSGTAFQLQSPPTGADPGAPICTVTKVRAYVQAIRADTLLLTRFELLRVPFGAPSCPEVETAMVVTSKFPDLQAEQVRTSQRVSPVAALALGPILLGSGTLLLFILHSVFGG